MNTKQAIKTQINESMPKGFKRLEDGIFYADDEESGEPLKFVCSPTLCIRARTVDEKGKWGILIEFSDFEGGLTRVNLTANTLRRPPALVVKLEEAGLSVGDDAALLSKFIRSHRPSRVIRETPAKSLQGVIIENIKVFVVKNQKRFQGQDNFVPLDRAGFLVDGEICFTKEALRAASGITATRAAKMLLKAGLLHRNDDHLNRKTNTPIGEIRLYCICTSIFEYDPQTLLTPISNPATPVFEPKPQFDPSFENPETSISNGRTPETPVLQEFCISEKNDSTNFIVKSIKNLATIDINYQPSPAELDFQETMGGRNEPEDDDQTIEAEPDGWDVSNGEEDQDDDRSAALAAFIIEEGYPANRGGGLS